MSVTKFILEDEDNIYFRFYINGSFICRMTKKEMINLHNLLGEKVKEPPIKKTAIVDCKYGLYEYRIFKFEEREDRVLLYEWDEVEENANAFYWEDFHSITIDDYLILGKGEESSL